MVIRGERREERGERIDTIYLGGGTPSQLTADQLRQLFIYINKVYKLPPPSGGVGGGVEVTIECNPDDITPEYAEALSQFPVNRVSMGAQTFDDQRLHFLHRRHTANQVQQAVSRLREAGICNISIDLMYGFPGETLSQWERDIDSALSLDVEHLSAYCLSIEEGTALYELMRNEKRERRNEETERQMYYLLIDRLTAAGYEHYEISNFAKLGFRSRHNSSYWTDVPYIGLGAAAHSYDGHQRRWNIDNINTYIKCIENGEPAYDYELIDDTTRYNDRVMLALRTCEGLDLQSLTPADRDYLLPLADRYIADGLLSNDGRRLRLTRSGLFVSDMVISDLMRINDD
jgi:oxygen-independent coproporphyrinogen-3 oxidase